MIRFGGPIFLGSTQGAGVGESHGAEANDPVLIARAHKAKEYTAAYAPRISLDDKAGIDAVRKAFAAEDIMIAEVGYWDNLVDTDPETKRRNWRCMHDALALAEELGAACAVDIFGSYCHGNGNAKHVARNFSQEAFDEAVEMARSFLDSVKPKRACFTYEIFPFSVVDSPEMIAKLIKAVDREMFGVHLDLVNLINSPRAYWTSGDIMHECVRLFGDRIVAAHAKDIKMKEPAISVILDEVIPGQGMVDIAACVRELHGLPRQISYMMEHLRSEHEYDQAAAHIRKVAAGEGIAI